MSITSQLPPIPLAQASASLRALAQAAGQTVEARVLSQSDNGTSQVQIGRQVLNLTLPETYPVGSTLSLAVQQSDGQLRLALLTVRPPGAELTPSPSSGAQAPATSVQLSAAALSSPSLASSLPSAATPLPASAKPAQAAASPAPAAAAGVAPRLPPAYGGPGQPAASAATPPAAGVPSAVTEARSPIAGAQAVLPTGASGATSPVAPGTSMPSGAANGVPAPAGGANSAPAAGAGASVTPAAPAPAVGDRPAVAIVAAASAAPQASGQAVRAEFPYAVAAPAAVAGVSAASAAPGGPAPVRVGQMTSSTMAGQHPPPGNMGGQSVASGSTTPAAPPPAASPQAALAQMVQQSLPRQDSMLGLTTALTAIAGKVALPEPVAKAAQQVLGARLALDGVKLGGAAIKAAVQQSGIFQEALLASGQGQAATGDLKSGLMALRQGLGAWLGNQAPVAQVGSVPPPLRGQVPRARSGEGQTTDVPDDPVDAGKHLLDRTEAALSRLRLHQNSSLPDPNPARSDTQWNMDLPVIVAGQNQVLHMQIQRDAEQDAERPEDRGWQVRFAINLAERGEVGAQISLRHKNTAILLWADDEATARSLALAIEDLREDLAGVGLVPGAIVVRAGAPAEQPLQPVGQAGHYVDAKR